MNTNDKNKDNLIGLYIKRAERTIADADWLVSENKFELAAGRYYYACFYDLQALFIHDGVSSKTHHGVQSIFLRDYVKTGQVDETLGAWLSRMERLRELADYNCAYIVTKDEVLSMQQPARDIIATVKSLID